MQKKEVHTGGSNKTAHASHPALTGAAPPVFAAPKNPDLVTQARQLLDKGYGIAYTKQELEKSGAARQVVEETVEETLNEKSKERQKSIPKKEMQEHQLSAAGTAIAWMLLGIVALFIIQVGFLSGAENMIVLFSFIPSLITIGIIISIVRRKVPHYHMVIFAIPFFVVGLYFVTVAGGVLPALQRTDYGNISMLNLVISLVFCIVISQFMEPYGKRKPNALAGESNPSHKKVTSRYSETSGFSSKRLSLETAYSTPDERIFEYIHSIEDKSKALNFVVGRVYSDKHGGNARIRDKIKIDSEWYNIVSDNSQRRSKQSIHHLKKNIVAISERLYLLTKTEFEVFGPSSLKFTGIRHDINGSSRIIDVLIQNDKDPVNTYYTGAIDFCNRALEELDNYPVN